MTFECAGYCCQLHVLTLATALFSGTAVWMPLTACLGLDFAALPMSSMTADLQAFGAWLQEQRKRLTIAVELVRPRACNVPILSFIMLHGLHVMDC